MEENVAKYKYEILHIKHENGKNWMWSLILTSAASPFLLPLRTVPGAPPSAALESKDPVVGHSLLRGNTTGLIPGLRPANERRGYFVTTSLIDWAQA